MSILTRPSLSRRPGLLRLLLLTLFCLSIAHVRAQAEETPWPEARAAQWQKQHPWLVGCNFSPAYAINELEMWQADTFDPKAIDRELGWAQSLGFNSVRVFLHNRLWDQDSKGFLRRMDNFLGIADKHHIGVMFVLFDSCWDPFPMLGKQHPPKPFVHNSGWVQAPGQEILRDPKLYDTLKPYVVGVLSRFKNDRRVHAWDLFNEADNTNGNSYGAVELKDKPALALDLLKKVVGWTREVNPSQPSTVCVWFGDWGANDKMTPMQKYALENSDVISFHNYGSVDDLRRHVDELRRFQRPILCTEYMARPNGSTFDPNLGYLKSQGIAAYNWGFVSGKTQTIYPWDSWQKTYTGEPPVWFHDIFRPDGTPYRPEEVAYIRQTTGHNAKP